MGARSSQSRGPGLNRSDGHLIQYFREVFGAGGGGTNAPPSSVGHTATGGSINDYTAGGKQYRAHVFTGSGTFQITELGGYGATVDYLVVAGGGGGGPQVAGSFYSGAGGGGAGGLRTSLPGIMPATTSSVPVDVSSYNVVVGGGGASNDFQYKGSNGVDSSNLANFSYSPFRSVSSNTT